MISLIWKQRSGQLPHLTSLEKSTGADFNYGLLKLKISCQWGDHNYINLFLFYGFQFTMDRYQYSLKKEMPFLFSFILLVVSVEPFILTISFCSEAKHVCGDLFCSVGTDPPVSVMKHTLPVKYLSLQCSSSSLGETDYSYEFPAAIIQSAPPLSDLCDKSPLAF